LNKKKCKEIA